MTGGIRKSFFILLGSFPPLIPFNIGNRHLVEVYKIILYQTLWQGFACTDKLKNWTQAYSL
jgi:hypothetical protein